MQTIRFWNSTTVRKHEGVRKGSISYFYPSPFYCTMKRSCLDCGSRLTGRSDKKFCNANCRNSYNNRVYGESNREIKRTNNILLRNRRILMNLLPKDKTKVNRNTLSRMGFDFEYYTNTNVSRRGNTYFFCYEFGYLPLEEPKVLLVKRSGNNIRPDI